MLSLSTFKLGTNSADSAPIAGWSLNVMRSSKGRSGKGIRLGDS